MSSDRSWGKAYVGKCVRQPGAYGRDTKINLLLAISGDDVDRYRWSEHWTGEGTTGVRMINFIRRIINDIGQGTAGVPDVSLQVEFLQPTAQKNVRNLLGLHTRRMYANHSPKHFDQCAKLLE
jgi:hypothetical protein